MSTRYVWDKYFVNTTISKRNTKKYSYNSTLFGSDYTAIIAHVGDSYKETFINVNGGVGIGFSIVGGKTVTCNNGQEIMVGTTPRKYFLPIKNEYSATDEMLSIFDDYGDYSHGLSFFAKRTGSLVEITLEGFRVSDGSIVDDYVAQNFYVNTAVGSKGDYISTVSDPNRSAYSDNGITSVNWYVYKGSDNIDPTLVSYSNSEPEAGERITITVSPRTPVYGGTVYYQYQINGGSAWTDIGGKTTSTSKTVTIPEGAERFRVRVQASDGWGFTSETYVYGQNLPVSQIKAYATVSGKNLAGSKLYAAVGGKIRQVQKGYATVGGKIRKMF